MILALLGYSLDLSCLIKADDCQPTGICCQGCWSPSHLDKTDHPVHIKAGPALLPTETLTLETISLTVSHVLPLMEVGIRPSGLSHHQSDPVRGPPPLLLS